MRIRELNGSFGVELLEELGELRQHVRGHEDHDADRGEEDHDRVHDRRLQLLASPRRRAPCSRRAGRAPRRADRCARPTPGCRGSTAGTPTRARASASENVTPACSASCTWRRIALNRLLSTPSATTPSASVSGMPPRVNAAIWREKCMITWRGTRSLVISIFEKPFFSRILTTWKSRSASWLRSTFALVGFAGRLDLGAVGCDGHVLERCHDSVSPACSRARTRCGAPRRWSSRRPRRAGGPRRRASASRSRSRSCGSRPVGRSRSRAA